MTAQRSLPRRPAINPVPAPRAPDVFRPGSRRSPSQTRRRARGQRLPSAVAAGRLGGPAGIAATTTSHAGTLPPELRRDWVTPDGQARVAISPKGDPNDNEAMRAFARAVLAVEPRAIDGPISVTEAGDTVVNSFIQAGLWALLSIGILLWIVLRRFGDVLLTPDSAAARRCGDTGGWCCRLSLNFANIIALPLLLGVGVAFKIYYIMAWRRDTPTCCRSSLTRAVILSALTTATAFGSLWFSPQPGHVQHGRIDGAVTSVHDGRGGAVSAGFNGQTPGNVLPAGRLDPEKLQR